MTSLMRALARVWPLAFLTGCLARVDVTRLVEPSQVGATTSGGKLHMTAIVSGSERSEVPEGAIFESDRVIFSRGKREVTHRLGPNDVIEFNGKNQIVAVRLPGNARVKFVPGTAVSPDDADYVRGTLEGGADVSVPVRPGDKIEMRGTLEPGDYVPGVGHVATDRWTFGLAFGIASFLVGYAPTFYVGVSSPRRADRSLIVPLVGPWLNLARRPKCLEPAIPDDAAVREYVDCQAHETAYSVALPIAGVTQGVAALLILFGAPSRAVIVEEQTKKGANRSFGNVSIVPWATSTTSGGAITGTW